MSTSHQRRGTRPGLHRFAGAATLLLLGPGLVWAASRPLEVAGSAQEPNTEVTITNEWCPVLTDELVEPDIYTEYRGERVFLCCQKCLRQFTADPEAFAANVPALVAQATASESSEEAHGPHAEGSGDHAEAHEHGQDHEDPDEHSDEPASEHNHADHELEEGGSALLAWLGRFHPMVVHFPVALIMMAAAAELLLIVTGASRLAFAARFSLWGGALGALVAAPLGWIGAEAVASSYRGFAEQLLLYHRWTGVSTAVVALAALFACERAWRDDGGVWLRSYRALLLLCAVLVSVAGHLGASLIYGWEYLAL